MADVSITAANVIPQTGATVALGTAGASITAGQCVYKDTDGTIKLADADAQASSVAIGVATNTAATSQKVEYITSGNLAVGSALTKGEIYLVSTTAGGIAPEADIGSGKYVTVLGVATTTSNLKVAINATQATVP